MKFYFRILCSTNTEKKRRIFPIYHDVKDRFYSVNRMKFLKKRLISL